MRRRDLLLAAAAAAHKELRADVPAHLWGGYDFGPGPRVTDRLNQGPFGIEQDEGWFTIAATTASERPVPNFGLGLAGYAWEESSASLAVRAGREALERHVEKMASLPFVDVLYIRCDWRDVQKRTLEDSRELSSAAPPTPDAVPAATIRSASATSSPYPPASNTAGHR
jgi:hypothetical protein